MDTTVQELENTELQVEEAVVSFEQFNEANPRFAPKLRTDFPVEDGAITWFVPTDEMRAQYGYDEDCGLAPALLTAVRYEAGTLVSGHFNEDHGDKKLSTSVALMGIPVALTQSGEPELDEDGKFVKADGVDDIVKLMWFGLTKTFAGRGKTKGAQTLKLGSFPGKNGVPHTRREDEDAKGETVVRRNIDWKSIGTSMQSRIENAVHNYRALEESNPTFAKIVGAIPADKSENPNEEQSPESAVQYSSQVPEAKL